MPLLSTLRGGYSKQWSTEGSHDTKVRSGIHIGVKEGEGKVGGILDLELLGFNHSGSWAESGIRGGGVVKKIVLQAGPDEKNIAQAVGSGNISYGRARFDINEWGLRLLNLGITPFQDGDKTVGRFRVTPLKMGGDSAVFSAALFGNLEQAQATVPGGTIAVGKGPGLRGVLAEARQTSFNFRSGVDFLAYTDGKRAFGRIDVTLLGIQAERSSSRAEVYGHPAFGQTSAGGALCVVER